MSNPPIDHERDSAIAMTKGSSPTSTGTAWGPSASTTPAEFDPPAEFDDEHDAPISPGAGPAEDAIDVGDSAYTSADHLGARRPTDDSPIDLDGPSDSGDAAAVSTAGRRHE